MKNEANNQISKLIEQAIQVELNAGKLYVIFQNTLPEDSAFWWALVLEESNHAALFRSGEKDFLPEGIFPTELLCGILEELTKANELIMSLIEEFTHTQHSRATAFNSALRLELSAAEVHFQEIITRKTDSPILKIFQSLNKDDKNHIDRIKKYMIENQIEIYPDILKQLPNK